MNTINNIKSQDELLYILGYTKITKFDKKIVVYIEILHV
jgi:hypothetical protein